MKVELQYPGLCSEVTPAGNPRWRVRVEGLKAKKITIPLGPGHPDFQLHYEAARQGRRLEVQAPAKPSRGTLDEMCDRFLAWMEDQVVAGNLSALTLSSRRRAARSGGVAAQPARRLAGSHPCRPAKSA